MNCVILIVDYEHAGKYIKSFDPLAHDPLGRGRGNLIVTPNKNEAQVFSDIIAAMNFWKQQSPIVPLRDDGRPNRPLTAFSITFEYLDRPENIH